MFKLTLNRVRIDLRLEPATPLLVKSGDKGASLLNPERPDLMFIRTGPRDNQTVFIPGASIKGVVRSASERILRTVGAYCCDPLNQSNRCNKEAGKLGDENSRRGKGEHPQAEVHAMLCAACRTFGSQAMAGRVAFADAVPPAGDDRERANLTERRSGVSIDRKTGGPARGKLFDLEVVTGGAFETSIHMTNVQLWQVALLGAVLREMHEGFVRVGSAKTRGLGHMRVVPSAVQWEQTDILNPLNGPAGTASLRSDLATPYGLVATGDSLPDPTGGTDVPSPLGHSWRWKGESAVWNLLAACAGTPWKEFLVDSRKRR